MTEPMPRREKIRQESHLALGCGFGFALLVVSVLIVLLLART